MRMGLRPLAMIFLAASFCLIIWFGRGAEDIAALAIVVAVVGFSTEPLSVYML